MHRLVLCVTVAGCASGGATVEPTTLRTLPHDTDAVDTGTFVALSDTASTMSTPVDTSVAQAPCIETASLRRCDFTTHEVPAGAFTRQVHVGLPDGEPPPGGWPVAVLFQGSFFSAELFWEARPTDPFGAWFQTGTVGLLLGAGFAVVTPEALVDGGTFWNTNVPPFSVAWETSPDHDLMLALFDGFDNDRFGPLDSTRLYASGISSGGYMSSRMAVSYPGRFRALAIHSASYATCSGALCVLPWSLPADHPPTLFLHGERDAVVPVWTMQNYADDLDRDGIEVRVVRDPSAGHEWIDASPGEVAEWFTTH